MKQEYNDTDLMIMKMALNDALDNCKNPARYKLYNHLLGKLENE